MQLVESIKMALYTIMSNKMRTALTILGIVIGIASVIAMVSIGQGNQKKMEKEFQKMGSNRASLYMAYDADYSESDLYNLEDVKAIRQKYGHLLKGISPNAQMTTKYTSGKKELTVNLTGVNESYKSIDSFDLVAGRFLTAGDMTTGRRVVVLDVNMADKHFGTRDILGKQLILQAGESSVSYAIVGLYKKEKSAYEMRSNSYGGFIPITAYTIDTGNISFENLEISFKSPDAISDHLKSFAGLVSKRHGITGKTLYSGFNAIKEMKMMNKFSQSMTLFISVIAGISLVVGGIGIMNIMMVSVSERTREIGIRKAIGATRKDILSQFLVESSLLSGMGGIVGIIFGIGIAKIAGSVINTPPFISTPTILMTVLFSTFMGVFFGMYPANKASKLNPIDALRYE